MRGLINRIRKLPIRIRITLTAAIAMGCLFGLLGLVLNLQFQSSLNTSINTALRARAVELSSLDVALAGRPTTLPRPHIQRQPQSYAQILNRDGQIVAATSGDDRTPLLSESEIKHAFAHPGIIDRKEVARLYALPSQADRLVVVGVSLDQQQDAFITFNWELAAGMPVMLLLASVITYVMTGRLLTPVEEMRAQAATISTEELDTRLPLPASTDEIRRLAETLNAMLDRLHSGMERERAFIADASHELRGPLAALKSELEVSLLADRSDGPWREAVTSAVEETDRVIALAEDLLILASAQQHTIHLTPTVIDADHLLTRTATALEKHAESNGRTITVRVAEPSLTFTGDEARIARALTNLAVNALRYGAGTVTLSARRGADGVEFHVTDEGPGFPPAFLPHVFERFTRADPARARGGTGLGLAIVQAIAGAHHGQARAANRPDGGADVWLELPGPNGHT